MPGLPFSIHNSLSPAESPPAAAGARASPPAHVTWSSARWPQGPAARSLSQRAHNSKTPSACSRIGSHFLDPCTPCITGGGSSASGMRCYSARRDDYGAFLQVPPHAAGSPHFKPAPRPVSQHQSVPPAGGGQRGWYCKTPASRRLLTASPSPSLRVPSPSLPPRASNGPPSLPFPPPPTPAAITAVRTDRIAAFCQ